MDKSANCHFNVILNLISMVEHDPIIEFDKVPIYQNDNLVLANVCLTIRRHEFVYLIGRTGSGKSSLLKTLYGELPIHSGNASAAGFDLKNLRAKEIPMLRRKIGIVFQDFQLLMDRTVSQNLMFVMKATGWHDKKEVQKRLHEVMAKVGLETKGNKMPYQLSGGEQQRVGIARAIVNDPEIILADEPTGNLDPETSEGIISLLFDISKMGSAVLMATHNYSLFEKFPSRTLRCEGGNILVN
jgi:cell division transport system ATP-binding protein